MAAEIQRGKMALIDRYRVLTLRQKIALTVTSLARGQARLTPILLLAAVLAALVFCASYIAATATGGEFAARLSTASFVNTPSNHVQRWRQ